MSEFSIDTLRSIYITNNFYQYPMPWLKKGVAPTDKVEPGDFATAINTGWHILPNMLWGHVCNPRQWYEMVMQYQAIKVKSITCRLFNPIPIQSAVSFQGNAVFPAFNNTVYAMTYTDDEYETPWFDWWAKIYLGTDTDNKVDMYYEYNPGYKEGIVPLPRDKEFDKASEAAQSLEKFEEGSEWYPRNYFCKIYKGGESNLQQYNRYRRQFLPIYWYHFTFKQYPSKYDVTSNWEDLSTNFEMAYADPSGIFWDPLNRPSELGELRPGKNMVEFHWEVHESDAGIWFNTDRIGFLTPYGRPRPLQPPSSIWNLVAQPRNIDPRGPGFPMNKYQYLKEMGLVKRDARTVGGVVMAPEAAMGLPDWRRWPIVPSRWFYKEIMQQNPYVFENFSYNLFTDENVNGDADMSGSAAKAGDVNLVGPCYDFRHAGTEYELHKYPPTQWFIKGVPLMDAEEKRIPVELQMWMHIKVNLEGKKRTSALYAPSWGPYDAMNLYSINMDTVFGENYMRGRSGGARRTWYNPADGIPEMEPFPRPRIGELYQEDSSSCNTKAYPADIGTIHTFGRKNRSLTVREYPYTHMLANKPCVVTVNTDTMSRTVTVKKKE